MIKIGGKYVGDNQPCFIVAEIGINHNGDMNIARQLINVAKECDAVKFQKRTPELYNDGLPRETPWGILSFRDYRRKIEFTYEQYEVIDEYCHLPWFASCWDIPALDFMAKFDPPCYKIASACLTDEQLLIATRDKGQPIILSTGMSTIDQIDRAVDVLGRRDLILLHCTSTYPCEPEQLNLRAIPMLQDRYDVPVGYSGHEVGLQTSLAAVVMGACMVERHITLNRAMWGADQAASLEPMGLRRLVRDIRVIESAMGDGEKKVYDSELPVMKRLRRI